MPKTFMGVVSANPSIVSMKIAVDATLALNLLSAVVQYDVVDSNGVGLCTNSVRIDLLAKLSAAQRTAFTQAMKTLLTAAVNEYA